MLGGGPNRGDDVRATDIRSSPDLELQAPKADSK